jgi:hypothetical protein
MQIASWVFVTLLVIFLIAIVGYREVVPKERAIDSNTHMILGILCSILAGLAAFFMTGDIALQVAGRTGVGVQAAGGVALFLVVLWWWRTFPPLPQIKAADGSPMQTTVNAFRQIDELYPQIKAVVRNEPETVRKSYDVESKFENGSLYFIRRGSLSGQDEVIEKITPNDFKNLPSDDARYLSTLRTSMNAGYNKWLKLYPRRTADPLVEQQLRELAGIFCKDLERILSHLGSKGQMLEDHYGAMRSICRELEQQESKKNRSH